MGRARLALNASGRRRLRMHYLLYLFSVFVRLASNRRSLSRFSICVSLQLLLHFYVLFHVRARNGCLRRRFVRYLPGWRIAALAVARITIACDGAAAGTRNKWVVNSRRPLIRNVRLLLTHSEVQNEAS